MAKFEQFGSTMPGGLSGGRDCLRYEAMLADAIDGTLSAAEAADFERHLATCNSCSVMLAEAQRGAAWLEMLKPHRPEPSAALVSRILAETSVRAAREAGEAREAQRAAAQAASLLGGPAVAPVKVALTAAPAHVLPFRSRIPASLGPALHSVLQTRFAMTAAMAFFSVALTLNLTGVHLGDLHARDLRPANVKRGFFETGAHVVRYYENLRVVYELESRVRDLQHASDADPGPRAPAPAAAPAGSGDGAQGGDGKKGGGSATQPTPAGKPRSRLSGAGGQSPEPAWPNREIRTVAGPDTAPKDRHPRKREPAPSPGVFASVAPALPVSLPHVLPRRQKRGLA